MNVVVDSNDCCINKCSTSTTELLADSNEKMKQCIATTEKLKMDHEEYKKKSEESREVINQVKLQNFIALYYYKKCVVHSKNILYYIEFYGCSSVMITNY